MWFLVLVIYNAVSVAGNKKMRNIYFLQQKPYIQMDILREIFKNLLYSGTHASIRTFIAALFLCLCKIILVLLFYYYLYFTKGDTEVPESFKTHFSLKKTLTLVFLYYSQILFFKY